MKRKRKADWLREITKIICPKCEEYYLIRDMHKRIRTKKHKWEDGKITKIGPFKKKDILECRNCGVIRKYKKEKTIPFTKDNSRDWEISHGTLQHKKFRRERRQQHLDRLHCIKNLKKEINKCRSNRQYLFLYAIINEKLGGRDKIINDLMRGINSIIYSFNIILLKYKAPKKQINAPLLRYCINSLKRDMKE